MKISISYVYLNKNIDFTKISALQVLWGQRNPLRPTFLARLTVNVGRRVTILGLITFYTYIYYKRKHLAKFHDDIYIRDRINALGPLFCLGYVGRGKV